MDNIKLSNKRLKAKSFIGFDSKAKKSYRSNMEDSLSRTTNLFAFGGGITNF